MAGEQSTLAAAVPQTEVQYRLVAGWPAYRVGDDGSIWTRWKSVGPGPRVYGPWVKMGTMIVHGYSRVNLCAPGRRVDAGVHRLVLEAFVGPCPDGMECRHFPDPNPLNNALANLSWGTPQENADDRKVHGTTPKGERQGRAKLKEKDIHEIRRRAEAGERHWVIAKDMGVRRATITTILIGKNWKHVK